MPTDTPGGAVIRQYGLRHGAHRSVRARAGRRLVLLAALALPLLADRELGDEDGWVAVLHPQAIAVAERVFAVKGRLDKDRRAGEAGFDSFMTLGLAEIVLIPRALLERVIGGDLQLTVWIDDIGPVLAYKYTAPPSGSPAAGSTRSCRSTWISRDRTPM